MHLPAYIDHTLLKQDSTPAQIRQLCDEAAAAGFKAVCVPPYYVREAVHVLRDRHVLTATVIGFPFGYSAIAAKEEEIKSAVTDGADELDMVINIAALKSGHWDYLERELRTCLDFIRANDRTIKVIVESGILTREELEHCCDLYGSYPIDFMKTSTGYAATGATVDAVKVMRTMLPATIGIKAAGGIRTYAFAKELIDAGATRIGSSAGLQIMAESGMA